MDLDYILPFDGIPENGREIDGLDDKSELARRMMLVDLLRILGAVKNKKASRHFVTRPTQVILPLSPNWSFRKRWLVFRVQDNIFFTSSRRVRPPHQMATISTTNGYLHVEMTGVEGEEMPSL
jgi:hypothetical protein